MTLLNLLNLLSQITGKPINIFNNIKRVFLTVFNSSLFAIDCSWLCRSCCMLLLSFSEVYCRLMCSKSSFELGAPSYDSCTPLAVVSAAHKTCLAAGIPMAFGLLLQWSPGEWVERGSWAVRLRGCFRYLPWVPWLVGAEFSLVFMPMNISFN